MLRRPPPLVCFTLDAGKSTSQPTPTHRGMERKARKDKRIQNRQLEHDKLRNEKEQLIDDSNKMEFDKIDLTNKVENQKNDNKYL